LEPEGLDVMSLPRKVQTALVRAMRGLEHADLLRQGDTEYDEADLKVTQHAVKKELIHYFRHLFVMLGQSWRQPGVTLAVQEDGHVETR
jgi:tRNA U34 5-carboxymethylaminomethyl modifying enzyme MnmG/GidA